MGTGRLQALLASHKVTKVFGKAKKNDGDDNGHDFDFPPKTGGGKEESSCYIEAKTLEAVVERH